MAVITLAGEKLIAQKQQAMQPLKITEFVLAYVPSVEPSVPPKRNQALPPNNQIRLRMAPTRSAYVNVNEVVYSLILDNTVGNFDFNWLGLVSDEGVLVSANHMVVQSKRKNNEFSGEEGNNLTRNFLLKFSGAQAITNLIVTAETWQFNYQDRLSAMDALLIQLSTGMMTTQQQLVVQAHDSMKLSEFNQALLARLDANEDQAKTDRVSFERQLVMYEGERIGMDTILTAAIMNTQASIVTAEHERLHHHYLENN